MDYESLEAEMNDLIEKLSEEDADGDKYAIYVKRLGELQEMLLKGKELELTEAKQNDEAALKRRELINQADEIQMQSKRSKREAASDIGKTLLSGIFAIGAIFFTQCIEENDIIRTKGWNFISGIIPKFK